MGRLSIRWLVRRVGSYGIVSGICFVTNNVLLIALDAVGFPLVATLAISAAAVISLGFLLQSLFTFKAKLKWAAFGRYVLVMLPNVPIAYGLLWMLHEYLQMAMEYAAPIVTTLLLAWNAAGSVWALHRRSRNT